MTYVTMFLIFFIYSVIGYFIEIAAVSWNNKKINISRGYLIGPYLPIFGFGALFITLFLTKYQNDIWALFVMSITICCLLEYLTSLVLEKIFKLRWWDYSQNKFNLNGRVCLETGLMFGLGGVLLVKVLNPFILNILDNTARSSLLWLSIILNTIIVGDFIISTLSIIKLKIDTNKYLRKDATSVVKEEVKHSLRKYRYFHNRLFKAFPTMSENSIRVLKIKEVIEKRKENR